MRGTMLSDVERATLSGLWRTIDPDGAVRMLGPASDVDPARAFFPWPNKRYWSDFVDHARGLGFTIRELVREESGAIQLICSDSHQREAMVRFLIGQDGAVREVTHGKRCPPGFQIRLGGLNDWNAIAELIRDAPVITGDRSFSIWYRQLGAVMCMQNRARAALAVREGDGALAAVRISSTREAMEQETRYCFTCAFQAAVHPSARGHGLERSVLEFVNRPLNPVVDDAYGYVDAGNAAILLAMGNPKHWRHAARQLAIPVKPGPIAGEGRSATPEDAPLVLELLLGAHGREVLRPPYSLDWVGRRFGSIDGYRWDAIRLLDRAMLALWLPGDEIVDISPGRTRRMRVGYIGDFGFVGEDGLRDMLRLIDDARARAASLASLTSSPTRATDRRAQRRWRRLRRTTTECSSSGVDRNLRTSLPTASTQIHFTSNRCNRSGGCAGALAPNDARLSVHESRKRLPFMHRSSYFGCDLLLNIERRAMTKEDISEVFKAAQTAGQAWLNGDWEHGYGALLSNGDDACIFGPFGGDATVGATAWSQRSAVAVRNFKNGQSNLKLIQHYASGDLLVLVMLEEQRADIAGHAAHPWSLRVTQVYRREGGDWKLVHRHADPLTRLRSFEQTLALAADTK